MASKGELQRQTAIVVPAEHPPHFQLTPGSSWWRIEAPEGEAQKQAHVIVPKGHTPCPGHSRMTVRPEPFWMMGSMR